jgi:hypothetical protein
MRIPILLIAMFVIVAPWAGGQDTKQDTKKEKNKGKVPNYYPLDEGNEWQYRVTANGNVGESVTTHIAKVETVDGEKLARLEASKGNITEHLTQTNKGVFRRRLNGSDVEPPLMLMPYPPKVGAKWQGEITVQKMKLKYFGELEAEENIEVPAGKFKTYRVNLKLEDNNMTVSVAYWFAKDVGMVKQTLEVGGIDILLELEKHGNKKMKKDKGKD